jgi:HAD superfamily hydrolase (TIGR01509 family)
MMPIAVAWDIDGTLVDSEPVHLAALVAVSGRYGLDLSGDPPDRFLGKHLGDVWETLQGLYPPDLAMAEWVEEILGEYHSRQRDVAVIRDMLDAMHALHALGIPQACVSNSERFIVDTNIAVLGVSDLIQFSISRDDVGAGKPDPEPYLEACRRFGALPGQVVAVEDSDTGARSAHAAGLKVVRFHPERRTTCVEELMRWFEAPDSFSANPRQAVSQER